MKIVARSLWVTLLILIALYASSPYWLALVVSRQLPDGWRLEQLEAGYPGLHSIDLHRLRLHGSTAAGELSLSARDVHLAYHGLATTAGEAWLGLRLRDIGPETGPFKPADLSLPLLLPAPELPELRVRQLHLSVLGPAAPLPALDMQSLTLLQGGEGRSRLTAAVSAAGDPRYAGTLELEAGPGLINGRLRIGDAGAQTAWTVAEFTQQSRRPPSSTQLRLSLDTRHYDPEWTNRLVSGLSGGLVDHLGGSFDLRGSFSGSDTQQPQTVSLHAAGLNLGVRETELLQRLLPGLRLQEAGAMEATGSIAAEIRAAGSLANPALEADLDLGYVSASQSLKVHTTGLRLGDIDSAHWDTAGATGALTLTWDLHGPFSYTAGPAAVEAGGMELAAALNLAAGRVSSSGSARLRNVRSGTLGAAARSVDVSWRELDVPGLDGQLGTRTHGLTLALGNTGTSGIDFDVQYRFAGGTGITGHGTLLLDGLPLAPLSFSGNLQTSRFGLQLPPATIPAATAARLLGALQVAPPEGLLLQQGEVGFSGNVESAENLTAALLLHGQRLGLTMQHSRAAGAQFEFRASFDDRNDGGMLTVRGPVAVSEVALAGGLDVHEVRADVTAQVGADGEDSLEIEALDAQVLGGSLKLPRLTISPLGLEDAQAQLKDIDLGGLLALADIEGLAGSGRLDITLPFGTGADGVHVRGGTFQSTAPGRLAYKKMGLAASNIGLRALENFHFKSLSGGVDYSSDGNFRIVARLEGSNPDLYSGHAIVFNLDINGTLPQLFEALFLSGDFEQAVLKQLRKR